MVAKLSDSENEHSRRLIDAVEIVSPDRARQYLMSNKGNRPLRRDWVRTLAGLISRDEWHLTHQGIAFDWNGELQDGQHRLHAIVMAGKPAILKVTRGTNPAAFVALDQGAKRGIGDVLAQHGYRSTHLLGSAIGWKWRYDNDKMHDTSLRPSTTQALDLLNRHPKMTDYIYAPTQMEPRNLMAPSIALWLRYEFGQIDDEAANEFWVPLVKGTNLADERNPIFRSRTRLVQNSAARGKLPIAVIAAFVIKGWNNWRQGESRALIKFIREESFPRIHGERSS